MMAPLQFHLLVQSLSISFTFEHPLWTLSDQNISTFGQSCKIVLLITPEWVPFSFKLTGNGIHFEFRTAMELLPLCCLFLVWLPWQDTPQKVYFRGPNTQVLLKLNCIFSWISMISWAFDTPGSTEVFREEAICFKVVSAGREWQNAWCIAWGYSRCEDRSGRKSKSNKFCVWSVTSLSMRVSDDEQEGL